MFNKKCYLTICLSPSIQKSLVFENFMEDEVNRCVKHFDDASGKGVNVSRVLSQLGGNVQHITQLGGYFKKHFVKETNKHGIKMNWIDSCVDTRFCYTVINHKKKTTTELVEESKKVNSDIENKILKTYKKLLSKSHTVIISGSKAPGFSSNIFPEMVKLAKENNKKVILDIRGEDLINCIKYNPDFIKPNISEFIETYKDKLDLNNEDSLIKQVENIIIDLKKNKGITSILSRGKNSTIYTDGDSVKYLPVIEAEAVNTTGCGDAFTAGLAYYLNKYESLKAVLLRAQKIASLNAESYRPGTILKY